MLIKNKILTLRDSFLPVARIISFKMVEEEKKKEIYLNRPMLQSWDKKELIEYILSKGKKVPPRYTQKQKAFNNDAYFPLKMAFKFGYLGWNYHGLAIQKNIEETVEEKLFSALRKANLITDPTECDFSRAGRTDKGVSALGNVFALKIRSRQKRFKKIVIKGQTPEEDKVEYEKIQSYNPSQLELSETVQEYCKILNNLLPSTIRIMGGSIVPDSFNARFNCTSRQYKYFFSGQGLNIELMKQAASKLKGKHDFRNFCKKDSSKEVVEYERTIYIFDISQASTISGISVEVDSASLLYVATIKGSAFLWHQVLLKIAKGIQNISIIDYLLDIGNCPVRPNYRIASEIPLILEDAEYEGIKFNCNFSNAALLQDRITNELQERFIKLNQEALFLKYLNKLEFQGNQIVQLAKSDKKYQTYEEVPELIQQNVTIQGNQAFKLLQKRKKSEGLILKGSGVGKKKKLE